VDCVPLPFSVHIFATVYNHDSFYKGDDDIPTFGGLVFCVSNDEGSFECFASTWNDDDDDDCHSSLAKYSGSSV
jgi:hypothetical protein